MNYLEFRQFFHIFFHFFVLILCVHCYEEDNIQSNWIKYKTPKYCRYKNNIIPEEPFIDVTGHGCYTFGHIRRFHNDTPYKDVKIRKYYPSLNRTNVVLGGEYKQNGIVLWFTYDFRNKTSKEIIAASFRSDKYFKKWLQCSEQAENCCKNTMNNDNIQEMDGFCPTMWDGWDCFITAVANTTSNNYCPSYIYMGDPLCLKTSVKECFANGTWKDKTDYSNCEYTGTAIDRINFHVYALIVSILICLPAVIIFYIHPSLRITRVILHRNLLIAIIIKNVLVIMSKEFINLDALLNNGNNVLNNNGVSCRILAFFERVAVNSMYACMLVDGFYLHKIIVRVFKKDPPIYMFYITITALSLIPILIWATLKATLDDKYCWVVDDSWFSWVIDGSRYAMLAVNLILLLDIIRVLIWKLKHNNGAQHTKTTLRATLILLPLFGIQFIMMSQRPVNANCFWDDIFYYTSYVIDSLQGISVSMFYCYFNTEVQTILRRAFAKKFLQISSAMENRRPQANVRRSTTATYVSEPNAPRESKFISDVKLEPIPEENIDSNNKVQSWIQKNFINN